MGFDYFYGRGTEQFAFYQVPKMLITDDRFAGITMDSKFLYSLLLDRSSLSAKNGWLDEEGKTEIPRSVRAAETSAEGKSIFAYDPSGKVAEAYESLTQEVLKYDQKRN